MINLDEIKTTSTTLRRSPIVISAAPIDLRIIQGQFSYKRSYYNDPNWEPSGTLTTSSQTAVSDSESLLEAMIALTNKLVETSKDLDPEIAKILEDRFHELL